MALFEIPGHEPRIVAGWAFRSVLDRALTFLSDQRDIDEFQSARPVKTLFLDSYPADQRIRMAAALRQACDALGQELHGRDGDEDLAEYVGALGAELRSSFP